MTRSDVLALLSTLLDRLINVAGLMVMMDSGSISSVSILFARAAVLVPEVPVYMYVVCWETHFAASE